MIEETQTRPCRWARVALGLVALTTLSAGTGWGAAHLASPADAAPDLASVRAALKLRLPKTPIDAINCSGLGGLCEVASKSTLFYVDARAKYLVIGRIYDMEARQDLTAARLLALNPDLLAAGAARIARHRARRLYGMVWHSASDDAPFHARHHQVIISVGVPAAKVVPNEELVQTREGLIAMLKSLKRADSVQRTVIEALQTDPDPYDVIFDDDGRRFWCRAADLPMGASQVAPAGWRWSPRPWPRQAWVRRENPSFTPSTACTAARSARQRPTTSSCARSTRSHRTT